MKYDFDHWDKTEMTQEEALAWFESELEVTDGKRCSPTCPQCQAEEWAIKALSVKQKKGKWIVPHHDVVISGTCSCCGWDAILFETDVAGMPFCPNCGADMRDEDDNIPMEYFENGGI